MSLPKNKLLIAIINHGLYENSRQLRQVFSGAYPVVAIDSGSPLTPDQRATFDLCLPNVYYQGCLEAAHREALKHNASHVWIWASDVTCPDPVSIIDRGCLALAEPQVSIYAPSAHHSHHPQMRPQRDGQRRRASFADGFCFAIQTDLLGRTCQSFPDCRYGFGLDVHSAFLALAEGGRVEVDHASEVDHPRGSGYSGKAANDEWRQWRRRQSLTVKCFHSLARRRQLKTGLGLQLLLSVPWHLLHPAPPALSPKTKTA